MLASLVAQTVKRLPAMRETQVQSLGREDPWRRKWQPTPVFLPGKFHGWRSLVGWGLKESDTTEQLTLLLLAAVTLVISFATWVIYPVSLAEGFRQ